MIRFEVVERCVIGKGDITQEISIRELPAVSKRVLLTTLLRCKEKDIPKETGMCYNLSLACSTHQKGRDCFLPEGMRCPFLHKLCTAIVACDWEIYLAGIKDGNELGLQNEYGIADPVKEWNTQTPYEANKE